MVSRDVILFISWHFANKIQTIKIEYEKNDEYRTKKDRRRYNTYNNTNQFIDIMQNAINYINECFIFLRLYDSITIE